MTKTFSITANWLKATHKISKPANKESRPICQNLNIIDGLLVATDGYKALYYADETLKGIEASIPYDFIKSLYTVSKGKDDIEFSFNEENQTVTARLVNGTVLSSPYGTSQDRAFHSMKNFKRVYAPFNKLENPNNKLCAVNPLYLAQVGEIAKLTNCDTMRLFGPDNDQVEDKLLAVLSNGIQVIIMGLKEESLRDFLPKSIY